MDKTPKDCKKALDLADKLSEKSKQMYRIAGYAVSYASGYNDGSELDESERLADKLTDEIKATEAKYEKAAEKCRQQ
ncbi:hypothetical protein ACU4IU_16925 [Brevibacterium sp. CSND-B09]|uniref:hypothetical protein n=1 Tax=Brevibacterium sp. CSND-B09 TaxID=3462571 RepID=UPI00406A2D02